MNEDDTLPTVPAAESAAPAESETSEATTEVTTTTTEGTAETETDTDSEAETGDEDGDGQDDDRPRKVSRWTRLKRERDALAAKVAQMESRPMAAAADDPAALDAMVKAEIGDPPKEDDYAGDWFAYERALTAYETEKRIATRDIRKQATQAKQTQGQAIQALIQDHQDRVREARAQIKDFDAAVASANHPVSPVVEQLILESEKSAVIQYHLAKNPDVLDRLNRTSPLSAAKEIARLEDRLALPNPKTATKAAPPITSPKGGASPSVDLSKMSMDDYVKFRSKGAA